MEPKIDRNVWWMISLSILLSAFLISGCARSKQAVAPTGEEKRETTESASTPQKTGQEAVPSKAASTSSRPSPAPSGAPAASPAPGPVQEPLSIGSVLLNPALPQDAQMIQTRLSELGLYISGIDGIWGRGSRAALKAFKEKNSLSNPDKWDKETQILLFGGTGQNVPQAAGASQNAIASGAVLLNPTIPKDAQMIQTRLAEMGLYKAAIDGIWGKGSEAALRAFKEMNSLANPDKWDRETQILLFR